MHSDGACRGNPGVGGWGVVLYSRGRVRELYGAEAETTNNRMELMAAIQGFEALKRTCRVEAVTDSLYVRNGVTEWMPRWKANGWRTRSRREVKNQDLWQRLDQATVHHDVRWRWVKAHAGYPGNERADELANRAIDEYLAAGAGQTCCDK